MSATQALQFIETEIEKLRKENEALKDENAKLTKERDEYLIFYGKELMGNIDFQEKLAEKDKEISRLKREILFLKETTKNLKAKDVGDIFIILKGKNNE